jgi:2-polyprenyl-6-methoxyphenol hydroxylase-like FAD-dependent oxidoreductase
MAAMGSILVCGAGMVGLSAAMMLARDGHQVTVLEADPDLVPATPTAAWESWQRKGVTQFRQPHNLFPRFRQVCDEELPGLCDRLLAAGCVPADPLAVLPPPITDREPRPGDTAFRMVTGRRPVAESVFAAAAQEQQGVVVRRDVRICELVPGPAAIRGVPHVAGVRTSAGKELHADLVVDAMGRRSRSAGMLASLGGRPPRTDVADSGFAYYTRYFTGPALPAPRALPVTPICTISVLTLPGDNGTWSVTVFTASGDAPVKKLRNADVFTRVIRACPLQAHWLDGQPVTGVMPMAGILDRYQRFVIDSTPVVTGLAAVGDAWACTNPSAGRGLSIGLVHAQQLRQVVLSHLGEPAGLARAWDERTEATVAPFHWNQIIADRARLAEMTALRENRRYTPPESVMSRLARTAAHDATLFRAYLETLLCLALPQEVLQRPGITEAIEGLDHQNPPPPPGPDRQQLLQLLR